MKSIELNRDDLVSDDGKYRVISERVEIISDGVVAPDFRVLLYPYKNGDPMPEIRGQGDRITVTLGDQVRTITMTKDADGRSKVVVSE